MGWIDAYPKTIINPSDTTNCYNNSHIVMHLCISNHSDNFELVNSLTTYNNEKRFSSNSEALASKLLENISSLL